MNEPTAQPTSVRRIIGLILIAAGTLWMALSGLCSLAFVVTVFTEGGSVGEALSAMPMIVIVGGFSIGVGLVLFVIGRALRPLVGEAKPLETHNKTEHALSQSKTS
jgi:hypothetical protein